MHHSSRRMNDQQTNEELGAVLSRQDEWAKQDAEELAAWATANRAAWTEEYARAFSDVQRRKAAKEGASLPDGSYPIYSQEDANNAAEAIGRGKAAKSTVVAHIRKRVKALGLKAPPVAAAA